ncbi:MAG: hypothetical protein ABL930_13700 [Pseudobdellovibrio sp.]
MKIALFASKTALVVLMFTPLAFGQDNNEQHQDGPCMKLMEACKSAGFSKSLNEKKSLSKSCLQPLLKGEKVEGVTVNSSDIEACKAKKAEVKSKK